MLRPHFNSLKTKNSLILISVMLPLLAAFLTYDVYQQAQSLRQAMTERGVILAKTGAATAAKILTDAIKSGELTEKQIFDRNYRMIPGTSPPKYHTQFDAYTDENLRQIQDTFLQDKMIIYATTVDSNGYVPTHNTIYSQVGKGFELDRSKRLFDDPVGNAANKNLKPYLLQEYKRDTGETLWDISSPIFVQGKHWGSFRLALSIEETNKEIAASVNRSVLAGLVLTVTLVLLAVYMSIRISKPVKRLEEEINRVAEGDWSLSRSVTETRDEVGSLIRSFGEMVIKMHDLAANTRATTRLIATYTKDLLRHSENADQTADAVDNKLTMVVETMGQLEMGTEKIVLTTKQAAENLVEAGNTTEKFLTSMEQSKHALFAAHDVVINLESQVEKVGAVIQYVSILADQAGQLAARAVKEATRYSDNESDFSKLALEIQNRANSAADSSKEVSDLFAIVRDQAKQASGALDEHRLVILRGINVANASNQSLTTIVADLENLANLTRAVLINSQQLIDGVQGIHTDVEAQVRLVKSFAEAANILERVVAELEETINTIKV